MQNVVKIIPASVDGLTPQQDRFAAEYARSGNATASYRTAFDTNHAAVRVDACRLLRVPSVAARVADLRRIAGEALSTSVSELALQLYEVATASVADLQQVSVYNCRHCHGHMHRFQWDAPGDFTDAVDQWHKGKLPAPMPTDGGAGFNAFAPPATDCPKCMGAGVTVVRLVPTAELSDGARQLYAGAVTNSDGTVRYLTEDRSKYRDQLHRILGAYAPVKSESRNLSLSVTADLALANDVDGLLAAYKRVSQP